MPLQNEVRGLYFLGFNWKNNPFLFLISWFDKTKTLSGTYLKRLNYNRF